MADIDREGWTPEELDAERRMNEDGERIDQQVGKLRFFPSHYYYVLNKNHVAVPVGLGTWAVWCGKQREKVARGELNLKVVKQEDVGEFWVSTVFLGLDHSYGGGPRTLFETMVFTEQGQRGHDVYCDRYPTWESAVRGHEDVVKRLRAGTLFEPE